MSTSGLFFLLNRILSQRDLWGFVVAQLRLIYEVIVCGIGPARLDFEIFESLNTDSKIFLKKFLRIGSCSIAFTLRNETSYLYTIFKTTKCIVIKLFWIIKYVMKTNKIKQIK